MLININNNIMDTIKRKLEERRLIKETQKRFDYIENRPVKTVDSIMLEQFNEGQLESPFEMYGDNYEYVEHQVKCDLDEIMTYK